MRAFLLSVAFVSSAAMAAVETCSTQQKQEFVANVEAKLDRLEKRLEDWQTHSGSVSDDIAAKTASELFLALRDTRGDLDELGGRCSDDWDLSRDRMRFRVARLNDEISRLRQGLLAE